jgi:hypothetical protein
LSVPLIRKLPVTGGHASVWHLSLGFPNWLFENVKRATPKLVEKIALNLVRRGLVPPQVAEDALHIAIAAAHRADFILTWNFKHIANPMMQRRIASFLDEINVPLPFICTPEELLGEDNGTIGN